MNRDPIPISLDKYVEEIVLKNSSGVDFRLLPFLRKLTIEFSEIGNPDRFWENGTTSLDTIYPTVTNLTLIRPTLEEWEDHVPKFTQLTNLTLEAVQFISDPYENNREEFERVNDLYIGLIKDSKYLRSLCIRRCETFEWIRTNNRRHTGWLMAVFGPHLESVLFDQTDVLDFNMVYWVRNQPRLHTVEWVSRDDTFGEPHKVCEFLSHVMSKLSKVRVSTGLTLDGLNPVLFAIQSSKTIERLDLGIHDPEEAKDIIQHFHDCLDTFPPGLVALKVGDTVLLRPKDVASSNKKQKIMKDLSIHASVHEAVIQCILQYIQPLSLPFDWEE